MFGDSPYGKFEEIEEELREDGERVPWSSANTSGPDAYTKRKDSNIELAIYRLFDQESAGIASSFYDSVSREIVSFEEDKDSIELGDYIENEDVREPDLESLLVATAKRGIVGDSDTTSSQYGMDSNGIFYSFDFGHSGHPVKQEFTKDPMNGIVGMAKNYIQILGLENELNEESEEFDQEELEEIITDKLIEKMTDIASKIDIKRFKKDIKKHPHINRNFTSYDNYGLNQIIENIENLQSDDFDPRKECKEEEKSNIATGTVNLSETMKEQDHSNIPSKVLAEDIE